MYYNNIDIMNSENDKELISYNKLIFDTLKQEDLIDDTLHVITVISNICGFKRRYELMHEFIKRIQEYKHVKLYVVEMAYKNQEFIITSSDNPQHLQLRTDVPLWHKENMINLGVQKLLPNDWKSMAWIDGDIEFENPNWAIDALKVLTKFNIIQLFTTCFDLDEYDIPMSIFQSFCYKYNHSKKYIHSKNNGINLFHPGYAWAITREFYNKIGYLYDKGILGSGDYIIAQALLDNNGSKNKNLIGYKENIDLYKSKFTDFKVGYVPCNILHYFHGSKKNRKYSERGEILLKHNYDPKIHVKYDKDGILVPTEHMSEQFKTDILNYFYERNEDEYYDIIQMNKIK